MKIVSQPAGFEPARGDPNGFQVHRLNHSATTAYIQVWYLFIYIYFNTTLYYIQLISNQTASQKWNISVPVLPQICCTRAAGSLFRGVRRTHWVEGEHCLKTKECKKSFLIFTYYLKQYFGSVDYCYGSGFGFKSCF